MQRSGIYLLNDPSPSAEVDVQGIPDVCVEHNPILGYVAELVAQGLTNTEIGAALWIKPDSVKQALKRMFRKLDVSTRAQLVAQLQDVLGSGK